MSSFLERELFRLDFFIFTYVNPIQAGKVDLIFLSSEDSVGFTFVKLSSNKHGSSGWKKGWFDQLNRIKNQYYEL